MSRRADLEKTTAIKKTKQNKAFSLTKHIKCSKLHLSNFTIKDGLRETFNCEHECHYD